MSDVAGPELGLSDATKAAMPAVPAGWSAFPSLGAGFGAKKWFTEKQAYEDVVVSDPSLLFDLCAAVDAKYAPADLPVDEFETAVEEVPASEPEAPAEADNAPVTEAPAS